jgi:hypothetical protein
MHNQFRPIPTTKLLHFSVILNIVGIAIGVLWCVIVLLAALGASNGAGATAGVAFLGLVLNGLGLWWWIHCLSKLKTLRQYAEELHYSALLGQSQQVERPFVSPKELGSGVAQPA